MCFASGCDREARAKGLCLTCYARARRTGAVTPRKRPPNAVCKADGCNLKHAAKGFCSKHYAMMKRAGAVQSTQKRRVGCLVGGCGGKHKGRGYCDKHLSRLNAYGDPLGGGPFRKPLSGVLCSVGGCDASAISNVTTYCMKHNARWRKYGDPLKTKFERGNCGRDEWHKHSGGKYVWRYEPTNPNAARNGFVFQHRHVMSQMLGRPLLPGENVHHINGVCSDNRPENLELWVSHHPCGQRPRDLVSWATEIIERYGDQVHQGVI